MSLHDEIMNIRCHDSLSNGLEYKYGHRDARHAAAELAIKADEEIQNLKSDLLVARDLNKKRFNEGLLCGNDASRRTLIEAAALKDSYLDENEKLSTLLLNAEDEIDRIRNIAQQVHDRLLRGDSDQELLALLDQANGRSAQQNTSNKIETTCVLCDGSGVTSTSFAPCICSI